MEVNAYGRLLSSTEIEAKEHRELVGGLWDEIGALQFGFLREQGLQPSHRLLDVGCGALRGGVHFVRYLAAGGYHGVDINASLIEAGRRELDEAGLADKEPHLLVSDRFEVERFDTTFDCAVAVSLFTHLPLNHIAVCLAKVAAVLTEEARFFATYFEAPGSARLSSKRHEPGGVVTWFDRDPYHYSFDDLRWLASSTNLDVERIGEWGHPRGQLMSVFRRPAG